jgi:perosamine synthetase
LCFGKGNKRFEHVGLGNNLRMTNIQAAIGLAQMTKLTWQLDKKRHLKTRYKEGLKKLPIRFQKDRHGYESSHWMTGILIDGNASELIDFLRSNNIEARPFFSDLNNHFYGKRLPTSSLLAHKGLYLPSSSDISEDSLDKVISAIYDFYN